MEVVAWILEVVVWQFCSNALWLMDFFLGSCTWYCQHRAWKLNLQGMFLWVTEKESNEMLWSLSGSYDLYLLIKAMQGMLCNSIQTGSLIWQCRNKLPKGDVVLVGCRSGGLATGFRSQFCFILSSLLRILHLTVFLCFFFQEKPG